MFTGKYRICEAFGIPIYVEMSFLFLLLLFVINMGSLSFGFAAALVLAHTEMGFGVDFMMGTHKWHGTAPNDEQAANALSQLTETLGDY